MDVKNIYQAKNQNIYKTRVAILISDKLVFKEKIKIIKESIKSINRYEPKIAELKGETYYSTVKFGEVNIHILAID